VRGKFYGLTQNYFEIFNLTAKYNLDLTQLEEGYKAILKSIHPDRFINASDNEKNLAMIKSTQVNDAYQTLKNPIRRAQYILDLNQIKPDKALGNDFLMQQMEYEETLEDLNDKNGLDAFKLEIDTKLSSELGCIENNIDHKSDLIEASYHLLKATFLSKLAEKIKLKSLHLE
jgi:molecular chaperone HscB